MPSATPKEVLEILKFLRDQEYIQGLNSIPREKLRGLFGWDAKKMYLVLETCSNLGYVGLMDPSDIYLAPAGIKALLQKDS